MIRNFILLLPTLLSLGLWLQDGGRFSFWATSVESRMEVEIIEGMPEFGTQTTSVWEERFLFGIETPLLGCFFTVLFLLISISRKRSLNNSSQFTLMK